VTGSGLVLLDLGPGRVRAASCGRCPGRPARPL